MDNNGQTVYDLSIASLNFLDEHSLLKQKVKDAVLKKIISRCWKWALRKNDKSYFSKEFRIYLKSKFGQNIRRNLLDTLSIKHGVRKKG